MKRDYLQEIKCINSANFEKPASQLKKLPDMIYVVRKTSTRDVETPTVVETLAVPKFVTFATSIKGRRNKLVFIIFIAKSANSK